MPTATQRLTDLGLRFGPTLLRPAWARRAVSVIGSHYSVRFPNDEVRQWQRNVELATGTFPDRDLTRRGVESKLRNFTEAFILPSLTKQDVLNRVDIDPRSERIMRDSFAGSGLVCALPHQASWDLAGMWACSAGMAVATVAEELPGGAFEAYSAMRERFGFTVHPMRAPGLLRSLTDEIAQRRIVALVSDRVLTGRGLAVTWPTVRGGIPAVAPVGPAIVAARTGATLVAVDLAYTRNGVRMTVSDPIPHREGPEGMRAMTQDIVTHFAASIAANPADWHVFQPFFPGDRGPDEP